MAEKEDKPKEEKEEKDSGTKKPPEERLPPHSGVGWFQGPSKGKSSGFGWGSK